MNFEQISKSKYEETKMMDAGTPASAPMDGCNCGANMSMPMGSMCPPNMCMPIYECPEERVCHRYICYEVPHIKPCNTRIINHHIYRHTFTPAYSECEENVIENVFDRKCC